MNLIFKLPAAAPAVSQGWRPGRAAAPKPPTPALRAPAPKPPAPALRARADTESALLYTAETAVQKICLERQPEQQAAARLAEVRKRAATAFSEALEKAGKEAFESGASDDE